MTARPAWRSAARNVVATGYASIQLSIAQDDRLADVDVDYRSPSFPVSLFNGHLSAANSDVRAGDNAERHAGRWTGFQNWWRSFFGAGVEQAAVAKETIPAFTLPKVPRAGKKNINEVVLDFLQAWLVEGNVVAAMGYVSERSYACLAQDARPVKSDAPRAVAGSVAIAAPIRVSTPSAPADRSSVLVPRER